MNKKYYSQAGQDEWVDNFFASKKYGYFLDIGAYDGIKLSNTYYLEKDLLWNGICIEADPVIFKKLCINRKCKTVNIAVSDGEGTIGFASSGLTGRISDSGEIRVNTSSLKKIIMDHKCPEVIDYISLDIEGYESIALSEFPFDTHQFAIMTVEHNLYLGSDVNKKKINEILTSKGYVIYKENIEDSGYKFEDWYVNKRFL